MNQKLFLSIVSLSALGVGAFAIGSPAALLASKGAEVTPAAQVWVREVGALILAQGVTTFLMRSQAFSPALRAFLVGSGLTQAALLPIEIVAYMQGAVNKLSGIVPNSALHVVFAWGFLTLALRPVETSADRAR